MVIRFRYLLAAGAVAAMLGSPTAMAADTQNCTDLGASTTQCSSPGNVQINDSPPAQDFGGAGVYPGPYPVPWDEGGR
jgi:hypothetical protein